MIDVDHNPVETEDGVWTQYNGSKMRIAHVSCMAFQKKLARLQQPHAKKIEKGNLDPEIQKEILCKAMAGTILKDAEFVNRAKQPVPFTNELAEQVLYRQIDVREFVTEYAANLDNYRQEETEALGKP